MKIKKALYKTLTWRVIATLLTMLLVYLFSRRIELTLGVGILDGLLKTLAYFIHEKAWDRFRIK